MAFRRRRRFNGQWFPTQTNTGESITLDIAEPGTHVLHFKPLLLGSLAVNEASGGLGLSTVGGLTLATHHSYLIKRIVGQVFCGIGVAADSVAKIINVGCGIFVDRSDITGDQWTITSYQQRYDPLDFGNSSQSRFLWTRSWFLSPPQAAIEEGFSIWPNTNAEYGSIREGCFVDTKSKARIDYTGNLFIVYSAYIAELNGSGEGNIQVDICNNLRVFGKATQYSNR